MVDFSVDEKEGVIRLVHKLKYREPLSSIEKINLYKRGLIEVKGKGFVLSKKGKHYIAVVERQWGEI